MSRGSRQACTGLHQAAFRTLSSVSLPPASVAFLLDSLFHLEDVGSRFLRNVGVPPNYTALEARTPQSTNIFDVISGNIEYMKFEVMSVINMLWGYWWNGDKSPLFLNLRHDTQVYLTPFNAPQSAY
jgi:hypothetical protein